MNILISLLTQVFLSESLGLETGEGQRFFLSLLFFNNQLTINIPKGKTFGALHYIASLLPSPYSFNYPFNYMV